jgi:hypothetical protein
MLPTLQLPVLQSPLLIRMLLSGAIIATSLAAAGCLLPVAAGAAAGYSAYTYSNSELNAVASAGVDRTWRATLAAVETLQLSVKEQRKGVTSGSIRAWDHENTEIRITIERRSGEFTRIAVRVGLFGDEARSHAIIDTIKENLRS